MNKDNYLVDDRNWYGINVERTSKTEEQINHDLAQAIYDDGLMEGKSFDEILEYVKTEM